MYKFIISLFIILQSFFLFAQRGIVTGNMRDNNGEPIPGVTILIKGTVQGTVTDLDGNYRIECNVGDVLVFQFIGYNTQEKVVTADMLKSNETGVSEMPEKTPQYQVESIKSKAYEDLINHHTSDSGVFVNMAKAPYRWEITNCIGCRYFNQSEYSKIKFSDPIIKFKLRPSPLYYELEFNSVTAIKNVVNLPGLQTTYAQGRPDAGENTWFGAETNEIFSWGPKISNLAFDGSDYPFDINGRLVEKSPDNSSAAKSYDPYGAFRKGLLLKNSIKLTGWQKENRFVLSYTNRNEKGVLSPMNLTSDMLTFNSEIEKNIHHFNIELRYYVENEDYANLNGLWTNTIEAIMQTPPTFDNSQGYLYDEILQRSSAPDYKNNPEFVMNLFESSQKNTSINGKASYKIDLDRTYLNLIVGYSKETCKELYYVPLNSAGFISQFQQSKELDFSDFNVQLRADNHSLDYLDLSSSAILNFEDLDYSRDIENSDNLSVKKNRQSLNWMQSVRFKPDYDWDELRIELKNNSYITSNRQKWFLPYAGISYDFSDILDISRLDFLKVYANYNYSVAEPSLYHSDKSYNTLLIDLNQMNSFVETQDLFYDEKLDLESRASFNTGLQLNSRIFDYKLYMHLYINYQLRTSKNSIFPVQNGNIFELQNLAKIRTESWDVRLNLQTYPYRTFKWEGSLLFTKFRSNVKEINNGYNRIPIAGFQSVSKNLVVGQPVGVIIGSAYQRNENGQMIIGDDGFPLVAEDMQIIGDPNPDFYISFWNKFRILRNLNFSFIIDFQKGGDIWNGTKNNLSYLGLWESTASERTVTDYMYQGVTQNGEVNTRIVDFANPANGLEGNKWYRYGAGGVAEDAIEDGTWFRIKEIALSYKIENISRKSIKSIEIKLFTNNLLIKTKYTGASPLSWFNNYTQGQGLDYFNMPSLREFGIGINLTL